MVLFYLIGVVPGQRQILGDNDQTRISQGTIHTLHKDFYSTKLNLTTYFT